MKDVLGETKIEGVAQVEGNRARRGEKSRRCRAVTAGQTAHLTL